MHLGSPHTIQKAFDSIIRLCMMIKQLNKCITGKLYKDMYLDNISAVKVAQFFKCEIGFRQGDSLSPTLFNIIIDENPVEINNPKMLCLLYMQII